MTLENRIDALVTLAQAWQDPDHAPRADAVGAMLEGEARFTEESLAFALNHRMYQLGEKTLVADWLGADGAPEARTVGVTPAALDPLGGLAEAAAALVLGHAVVLEAATPPVAAFADDLAEALDGEVHTASRDALLDAADAWVLTYRAADAEDVTSDLASAPRPDVRVDAQAIRESVVVLDGQEDREALSGLAEDLLLHEGMAPGTPRVVWAPAGMPPDALLNALAGFREHYPPHPDTDGTLALPTAFLVAAKQSHATGPGFLVSLGAPEPQAAGHIRWAEYEAWEEVGAWLRTRPELRVVASPSVRERLGGSVPTVLLGDAHRPGLDRGLPAFLRGR